MHHVQIQVVDDVLQVEESGVAFSNLKVSRCEHERDLVLCPLTQTRIPGTIRPQSLDPVHWLGLDFGVIVLGLGIVAEVWLGLGLSDCACGLFDLALGAFLHVV